MNVNTHLIIRFPERFISMHEWEVEPNEWYKLTFLHIDEDPTYPLVYRITELSGALIEWFEEDNDSEITLTEDYRYFSEIYSKAKHPEVRTLIYPDVKGLFDGTI